MNITLNANNLHESRQSYSQDVQTYKVCRSIFCWTYEKPRESLWNCSHCYSHTKSYTYFLSHCFSTNNNTRESLIRRALPRSGREDIRDHDHLNAQPSRDTEQWRECATGCTQNGSRTPILSQDLHTVNKSSIRYPVALEQLTTRSLPSPK